MPAIRPAEAADFSQISAIQASSPEAAQWQATGYAGYQVLVAVQEGRVAGFLASRQTAPGERELLNLAVAPGQRRQGIARELLKAFLSESEGVVFLEVRASNQVARNLYKSFGFSEIGIRQKYYDEPPEAAIVMKFHSC